MTKVLAYIAISIIALFGLAGLALWAFNEATDDQGKWWSLIPIVWVAMIFGVLVGFAGMYVYDEND